MRNLLLQKAGGSDTSAALATKLYTSATFQKVISDTEQYLLRLKEATIEARADISKQMPYCMHLIQRLNKYSLVSIYSGPFDQYVSELCLQSIDEIINHNAQVGSLFISDIDDESMSSGHGRYVYISRCKSGTLDGTLSKFTLLKPEVCPQCNLSIVDIALQDHMKKSECKNTQLNQQTSKANLVQLDMNLENEIVKTVNIPYELRPIGYTVLIPDWVQQAIKTYNSMVYRGGFQDMSLSEYLNSIAEVPSAVNPPIV